MNTNMLVYTDKSFENKDAALAYLKDMGVIDIVNEAYGSVVLVTPADPKAGFGAADQYAFFQLQSAMCNIGYTKKIDDKTTNYYADSAYYGGLTYRYLIGIDGGATFINNYIASTFDYISRIAGLLLVNGNMDRIRNVATFVPVYLVNATDEVVEKYKSANAVDASGFEGDVSYFFNQAQPLQKVYVSKQDQVDLAATVKNVYYNMFVKALRNASLKANLYSASMPFADYKWNMAPYSLSKRNAIINGVTKDGLNVNMVNDDRFSSMATDAGNYVDTWFEVLPEEVKNNTAPAGSVPLILANHGAGDDPIQFLDEMDWLSIAGAEHLAIVAPYHTVDFGVSGYNILCDVLPELVKYMLATYPALDPSRVYVTGYSMGGGASNRAICSAPQLFAAAVPQAALAYPATDEQKAQFDKYDIPVLLTTSTYDAFVINDMSIGDTSVNPLFDYQGMINQYLTFNGMKTIAFDFDTYRYFGAKADIYKEYTLNNEYRSRMWLMLNDKAVPMVGLSITDFLPHGLYQEYGDIAWDFMKHYSRNQSTGEIIYNPYIE
jgi:pimeloyl-ACP methyl ester carboxylesterase